MKLFFGVLTFLLIFFLTSCQPATGIKGTLSQRVDSLLHEMTLEEKVGQMAQITLDVITKGPDEFTSDEPLELDLSLVRKAIVDYKVGSILNTANNRARTLEKWNRVIHQLQQVAIDETRLGIPVIYGIDAIHGATYTAGATFFPQQIGLAATWNRELVKRAAEITAYEVRASGIPWNFSPVLDLGRDPRFPRMWETFGEDVHLASELGQQMVKGYQGDSNDVANHRRVAACLKHFLGYSVPRTGKDRTPAYIPGIELRERHLPPFQAAIEQGARSVMINSGLINGIPVHANRQIVTSLLKEELGFTGVVVTDWKDIYNLHDRDRVAASEKEAVKLAINAGIDMAMIPYDFNLCEYLVELVQDGEVSMERIDDAVSRILTLKYELGLFEKPVTEAADYPGFGSRDFEKVALDAAVESITLLKNEEVLPLEKGVKVLVTGPNAHSMRSLNGGWSYSWQGEKVHEFAEGYHTLLEAVQKVNGEANVIYEPGVLYKEDGKYWEEKVINIEKVANAARSVDYVILCLGENTYTEKPGDLHDLELSANQLKLAKAVAASGTPIVLVLNEGRPRLIRTIEQDMDGILQMYLPGNFGGDALAKILFGEANPSGKLPYTYPMYSNSLATYDHKPSEEQNKMAGMYDYASDFAIQYPFGFGLSYTRFEYTDLQLSKSTISAGDSLKVSVIVKNTGSRAGREVIQLFTSDRYASVTPDVKRLRAFEKITLPPGESREVSFDLHTSQLAFVGGDLQWRVESGDYEILLGGLTVSFQVKENK